MKYILLLLLFSIYSFKINSQTIFFENNFKKNERFNLSYYVDSTKKQSLEEITKKQFKKTISYTNFGFVKYPFWIKIDFQNNTQKKRFFLEMSGVDNIEFWQKNDKNNWEKIVTGEQKPFYTRPIVHRSFLFLLNSPQNIPQTIYIKNESITRIRLQMTLFEEIFFYSQERNEILFYGFFYGIIFLMLVYNFLIWLRLRDTAYLFYVSFAAAMFMVQFTSYGFAFQYFFPNTTFFNGNGMYIWVGIANVSSANFCRYFLDLRKYSKFWDNLLFYVSFYGVSVIVLSLFLSFPNITSYIFLLNPLYSLFLVSIGIIFWRKGNVFAPYFSFAWLAYVVGLVIMVSYNRGFISYHFLVSHALQISTIIEIVILSLAMSYKHKILDDQSKKNLLEVERLRFAHELEAKEKEFLMHKHELEQEKMEEVLSFKERELAMITLQIFEKNNFIQDIQKKLQKFTENITQQTQQDFKHLTKSLKDNLDLDADWDNFKIHFEKVHPFFFQRLTQKFPTLTMNDLKMLTYLKINLGTKDIARLLNIEPNSMKMTKYRLKKKLEITDETDLESFLRVF
ncbi:MAG: hypothetical protein EAZ85_00600 [Bacteroidetes bacterium]|nr:MAG: hypothetical protein EAZ85_00600 [Bacteroidota bacterium]